MTTILKMRDGTDLRRRLELCGPVRIDRRKRCGNPWVAGRGGSHAQVIARYCVDLWRRVRAGEAARRRSTASPAPR